jgi:uncharacterized damage-inducible protein DinB
MPERQTARARFLKVYEREHATTSRVLHAHPKDQTTFAPHERSNSTHALGWTFVVEEQLMLKALKHEDILGAGFAKPPQSWDAVLDAFDRTHDELLRLLNDPADPDLEGTTTFFVGPKQTAEIPVEDFLWFMLSDQIHHRGQLSVHVRMTGGKVPSIYGPTADEPWS